MKKILFYKDWPLFLSIFILFTVISALFLASISKNGGRFVYPIDDTYIHMSMAKNFAFNGQWSVSVFRGFTSSSSSILYTLLLALSFLIFGNHEIIPFLINVFFAVVLIAVFYFMMKSYHLKQGLVFVALLAIIFFTPLPNLIFIGMEHVLHILLSALFVYFSAKIFSGDNFKKENTFFSKEERNLLLLAPLMTATRYESLFFVVAVCVLFLAHNKFFHSIILGITGALPPAFYGLISYLKGWFVLPNSVFLKANAPVDLASIFTNLAAALYENPHIVALLGLCLGVFFLQHKKHKKIERDIAIMISILLAVTAFHMQFAKTGWFFRYEAYLVAIGIFVVAIGLRDFVPERTSFELNGKKIFEYSIVSLVIFFVAWPFFTRGLNALSDIPQATANIYRQQYQMGLFLKEFYSKDGVALNDIGAPGYLADINIVDVWGLANMEVARAALAGEYDSEKMDEIARLNGAKIAIVYDSWWNIPIRWIKVGEWKILNNVVAGDDRVSFYAFDAETASKLIKNLRAFSLLLPADVEQSGQYLKKP